MALKSEKFFRSSDGKTQIHVDQWIPENQEIRGVVQIAHGVAEYGKRYDRFAEYLCEHGFVVVANDHLGHGSSLIADSPMVYFGEKNGWWHVVDDMEKLRKCTSERFAGKPYFLFGHSLGSFLSRTHLIRYPGKVDGCILSGTGNPGRVMVMGGRMITGLIAAVKGKKEYSPLVDHLIFGAYNKKFRPNRTPSDWLSVNPENVDDYIKDPLCGGQATLGLIGDMLSGISFLTKQSNIEKMNKNMPVLFISGEEDPVGDMGKGVRKAETCFKKAGIRKVDRKLYKGLRHEILNEKEWETVCADAAAWLDACISEK